MIPRQAQATVERLARGFPVVALTGPRQSGKTTLARAVFASKPYVSLENPDERAFADEDPKRFLARFAEHGAVIDEIQRCPTLLSWLQGIVDERQLMGDFIITGSSQFELVASITQSLAGRVGRVELLPLSLAEIQTSQAMPNSVDEMLFRGGFPALYVRDVSPEDWFRNYIATYVERDVRQLIAIRDLGSFQTFVRMCAARTGQLLNVTSLATDCGIKPTTAKQWLTVLEASYIVTFLRPHHQNFGKRLVKSPKLYFLDVGLATWLLGIRDAETLLTHAARGPLFETWVVSELYKQRFNQGAVADLYFWRDSNGNELDVLFETAQGLVPFEIKSGCTFVSSWMSGLKKWRQLSPENQLPGHIIYGGSDSYKRNDVNVWGWRDISGLLSEPSA